MNYILREREREREREQGYIDVIVFQLRYNNQCHIIALFIY